MNSLPLVSTTYAYSTNSFLTKCRSFRTVFCDSCKPNEPSSPLKTWCWFEFVGTNQTRGFETGGDPTSKKILGRDISISSTKKIVYINGVVYIYTNIYHACIYTSMFLFVRVIYIRGSISVYTCICTCKQISFIYIYSCTLHRLAIHRKNQLTCFHKRSKTESTRHVYSVFVPILNIVGTIYRCAVGD